MTGYDTLSRTLLSAGPQTVRFALWCEAFSTLAAGEAARLLEEVARKARHDALALQAYLGCVDLPMIVDKVGPARMHEVLEEASRQDLAACRLLLEYPGARHLPDELGPPPDPMVEYMSLGQRKTAARGVRGQLLERLLKDPDPRVVAQILLNPRLREREVVAVASRRPAPEATFWCLVRAPRWLASPIIRTTMALNPYAPPRLGVALLFTFARPLLREISKTEGLHRAVREGALEILSWKENPEES